MKTGHLKEQSQRVCGLLMLIIYVKNSLKHSSMPLLNEIQVFDTQNPCRRGNSVKYIINTKIPNANK